MRIALIGYGKMGKAIASIAEAKGHEISARINASDFDSSELDSADVAIEFSRPEAAADNIRKCFEANVPVVVGTTGWYEHFEAVRQIADEQQKGLFTATNFSIGVNILFHINSQLAKMMNGFEEYDVEMAETHHIHKLDHPSGTAVTIAEGIVEQLDRKNNYVGLLKGEQIQKGPFDLQITCSRENEVPGYHEIRYTSDIDEIKLSHNAFNRMGFAKGALIAAEYMKGKVGYHSMKDLLNF